MNNHSSTYKVKLLVLAKTDGRKRKIRTQITC